jgi:hypothetical protein
MNLDAGDVDAVLYCVAELIDRRHRAGVPTPDWMLKLGRRFDFASLMSASGHESDGDAAELEAETLIGSLEAADFLGLSTRQVRRLVADLQAEKVGGRLVFRRSMVVECAE